MFKRAVRNLPAFPEGRLRGLHVKPPQARVDEVFTPAQTAATRDRIDSATTPWGLIAGGALAAALVLGAGRPDRAPAPSRGGGAE